MKRALTTEKAFAFWIVALLAAFIWTTFFKGAPFDSFAYALTGGLAAVIGKRLFMKHGKFNNGDTGE